MESAKLVEVSLSLIDDHPQNPRLVFRQDVIDGIVANLNGSYPQKHAIHVRPTGDRYQLISGHHRKRAAEKKGYESIWCWVEELSDEESYMALATSNNQGEISPLEVGMHALHCAELGKRGKGNKGGGLKEYAEKLGQDAGNITRYRQAAEVAEAAKDCIDTILLIPRALHLAAIHKADSALWQLLAEVMLAKEWSVRDTAHWVEKVMEFDMPEKWQSIFLDQVSVVRHFLETKEFSARTVKALALKADSIESAIEASEFDVESKIGSFHAWLNENAGGESWDLRALDAYERELKAEIDSALTKRLSGWNLGGWESHIDSLEDGSVAALVSDPPYGIEFQSDYRLDRRKERKHSEIKGDDSLGAMRSMLTAMSSKLKDDSHVFIFCHWSNEPEVRLAISDAGYKIRGSLIWAKNNAGMGDPSTTFAPQHERIIHAVKGSPKLFERASDVLSFDRCSSDRHPTEKPTDLLRRLIEITTVEGELVADPFGGVASTCVAALELEREYWGCEIKEEYHAAGAVRLKEAVR